jgi:hypothetical protein
MALLRHRLFGRRLVQLFAALVGITGLPASSLEVTVEREALHARVQAVREFVQQTGGSAGDPGVDAQYWPNWPNWGNWRNWGNWPNWPNWLNWFNR